MVCGIIWMPNRLMAQDGGIMTETLEVPDSAHLQQQFMADAIVRNSNSGNALLFIIVGLIVLTAVVFFIIKKRKDSAIPGKTAL